VHLSSVVHCLVIGNVSQHVRSLALAYPAGRHAPRLLHGTRVTTQGFAVVVPMVLGLDGG